MSGIVGHRGLLLGSDSPPPGGSDPYFANVVLLVDASARADGSTPSDIDVCGKTPTWRGAAQCKTDQFKFGSSSIYLRGDSTADRVIFADSDDWAMGTGDATWEMWARPEVASTQMLALSQATGFGAFYSAQFYRLASNALQALVSNGAASYGSGTSETLVTAAWNHLALVRSGANLYSYVNGVRTHHSASLAGVTLMNSTGPMCIGTYADDGDTRSNWRGWIDQVRITKGVARYTAATISVPTEPFPHS